MDPNLPPEILILAKASPWVLVTILGIRQLGELLSPFACVFALRFARSAKERMALLELFRIARNPRNRVRGRNTKLGNRASKDPDSR